jgi:ABC-type transport system involved in multi-copper enzyme maturation permease subunit
MPSYPTSSMSILPIARITLLEVARSRLAWLIGAVLLISLAMAGFLQQVAVIEAREIQVAIIAALLRACAVFFLVLFVVMSVVREANDKFFELVLSQAAPRASYLLGKFLGAAAAAALIALVMSLPIALFAPLARVPAWTLSLFGELLIMAAVSLFCVLTFTHVLTALSAAAGFYLLARSIAALQIIAATSEHTAALAPRIADWLIHGVALLMPRLDRMTQTGWLIDAPPDAGTLVSILAQTVIYVSLILSAALFDLYRQDL